MKAPASPTSIVSPWLNRVTGFLLLCMVVAAYAVTSFAGGQPPGHPFSGLSLGCVALAQILDVEHSWVRAVIYGCALGNGLPWLVSVLGGS